MRRITNLSVGVRAWAGPVGGALFTVAWVVATPLQPGYGFWRDELSGLASLEARHAWVLLAGFVALAVGTAVFATVLPRRGRSLVLAAAAATVGVALFRRDCLTTAVCVRTGLPADADPSWHNHLHDMAAVIAYGCLVVAPFVLARGMGHLGRLTRAAGLAGAALAVLYVSKVLGPWNGLVQKLMVTAAIAWMTAVARRPPVNATGGAP